MKKQEKKSFIRGFCENFKKQDKLLLFCTITLALWGLFNIVTASSRESVTNLDQSLYFFFFKHLKNLIFCMICSLIIINLPSKTYYFLSTIGFVGIVILIIIALISSKIRGANNWLFGGSVQPSEFAKPILIVFLACTFEKYQKKLKMKDDKKHIRYVVKILLLAIIIPFFVVLQHDLGTAIIIGGIVGMLYLVSPMLGLDKLKSLGLAGIIGVIGACMLILTQGNVLTAEQSSRIKFTFDPCQNYENGGYQVCNGYIAFNQGGLFGLGLGKSQQKYSYIPEPHTDSVFAIIAEELGVIKSGFIFILYAILLYRIFKIASRAEKTRGKLICVGAGTYIFIHILVNLGGLFGMIPLTGVPLPFFTYGGSFTLSLLVAIAFVQRIHIETKQK